MMRLLAALVVTVLWASPAAAACVKSTLVGADPVPQLWICQTAAEIPASGFRPGDIVIALDTKALKIATSGTVTEGPTGGSASAAWADITNKPASFTPSAHAHPISDVTNLQAGLDGKAAASHAHSAVDLTSGTVPDARFPATLPALSGANLTNLDASDLASGAVPDARLSANVSLLGASIDLASEVTGNLPVARLNGGTGADATKFWRGDASWAVPTVAGVPTLLRVAANVANSTVNFADVTGLTTPVSNGVTYRFACELSYTTAATTTALQLAINGPAMTALDYEVVTYTAATAVHAAAQTAVDTTTNPATGGGATRLPVRISGSFIPSASGTFAVRSRSEVNASAATVMRGGWCAVY